MIIELKTFELYQRKFAEYIRVKAPYRWQTELSNEACFIYWLNGENRLFTANNQFTSHGKEALLLKCGTYIDDVFPKDTDVIEAVIIHFYPDLLKTVFQNEVPQELKLPHSVSAGFPVRLKQNELLEKYIDSLLFYFKNPELTDPELLLLKLKELILLLGKTQQRHTLHELFRHLFNPEETVFKNTIETHLYSGLRVKELAYLTHRSLATFKRDFEKVFQAAPAAYIRNKKLHKAVSLLTGTSMLVSEVASNCGFINEAHFSRAFRKKFGLTPSGFRLSQSAKSLSRKGN